jgi:hypothetical protein
LSQSVVSVYPGLLLQQQICSEKFVSGATRPALIRPQTITEAQARLPAQRADILVHDAFPSRPAAERERRLPAPAATVLGLPNRPGVMI